MRLLSTILLCLVCAMSFAEEYTFLWWADGWRGRAAEWHKTLNIQTSRYGAAIDVEGPGLAHLGRIADAKPYAQAVADSNDAVNALPPAGLRLAVVAGGVEYRCAGAAGHYEDEANFPVRILDSGRWMQRADILHVVLKNDQGQALEGDGRIELIAAPRQLRILFEFAPKSELVDVDVVIALTQDGKRVDGKAHFDRMAAGERGVAGVAWTPDAQEPSGEGMSVTAKDTDGGTALPVQRDALRGWYYVDLPERQWNIAEEPDRLDRFPLHLTNTSDKAETCLLLFAFEGAAFQGITGLCPMLRDAQGFPTGIPVQISKNWHSQPERHFLYEGPWLHAYAEVTVEPGMSWDGELALTYARWGGVPAASHAQLCLVGWGVNQLWDQAAIGSWGESITYDPDINLNRSMIDDVRPLMVTGMNGGQWEWTCNVGGGDFLVYVDPAGKRQFLTRMRTAYLSQGPNLTDVIYAGVTADGKIAARIEVSTPRCDDVNRAYHRMRYDILEDTPFSRLAFYQLGADHYNDHSFSTIARGNAEGLIEEWQTGRGGKKYLKTGLECPGRAPWFSLHGGERNPQHPKGAWANRGLVIRSWKARLAGQDVPVPFAAVFGTDNGVPSANVELAPPPEVTALKKGDYVEAEVELLIVPAAADSYYGPNERLRADLAENANTSKPVQRLARGNDLEITIEKGSLRRAYPPQIAVDREGNAAFNIKGGMGYVPITITGSQTQRGSTLECDSTPVDQSVHGNDFWQTTYDPESGTWSHTYNIRLDTNDDAPGLHHFRLTGER